MAELIEGGAIRGTNLFHSFSDFNVETLQRVYFANPAGIETILTRVTGGNGTSIDGTLGVDGLADLYLLNPNGIAFGPNAQFDIRGSFVASTANSWNLGDGMVFSAVDPEAPPLLAVTLTPGLQYGTAQQADITNDGNLAVAPAASLVLMGDTVTHTGMLTAPGGNVQLLGNRVGVFGFGQIEVSSATGGGTIHLGGGFQGQGPLPTAQQTVVGPNASLLADATATGNGGEIIVWSDGLTRFYGSASARGGAVAGDGGLVEVSGLEQLVYDGQVDTTAVNGAIGTLLLDPTNIIVSNAFTAETVSLEAVDEFSDPDIGGDGDTRISFSAINEATSNVVLQATDTISFEAPVAIAAPFVGLTAIAGDSIVVDETISTTGGAVSLEAQDIVISESIASAGGGIAFLGANSISISNGAVIESGDDVLDAEAISIQTPGTFSMTEGSQIRATAFGASNGSDVDVMADTILLDGVSIAGAGGIATRAFESGSGGNASIETNRLSVSNGALIASVSSGVSNAGDLLVNANQIELLGDVSGANATGIISEAELDSIGGNIEVIANDIFVANGAALSTGGFGNGAAGNLSVSAEQIAVDGATPSNPLIGASIIGSVGNSFIDGGDVSVNAIDNIVITNGGVISTANSGAGTAGNLSVITEQLSVDGFASLEGVDDFVPLLGPNISPSSINSRVFGLGDGGDVFVSADTISITNGGTISTPTLFLNNLPPSIGNAGNLSVTANQIEVDGVASLDGISVSVSNISSQVSALGNGGNIIVDSERLSVTNGATISTPTLPLSQGNAGSLLVFAEQIELDGIAPDNDIVFGASSINSQVLSTGSGGNVVVSADTLSITNGANILTSSASLGNAGNLSVLAEQIELDGATSVEGIPIVSGIVSEVLGTGSGGEVTVDTTSISLRDGALISTSNRGDGVAGDLTVTSEQLEAEGFFVDEVLASPSGIASVVFASGSGGSVTVDSDIVSVTDGAIISTSNLLGTGTAGDLSIVADTLQIEGVAAFGETLLGVSGVGSQVLASGSGGNVTVDARDIAVTNGANISTSNTGSGNAGVLSLIADSIEVSGFITVGGLSSASGITSEVQLGALGAGGNVTIEANDLSVINGAGISTVTMGNSDASDLEILVTETVALDTGAISSSSFTSANSGDVLLTASDLTLLNGSLVSAGTFAPEETPNAAEATAGEVDITTDRTFLDQSEISTTGNLGDGGNLFVDADDFLILRSGSRISTTAGLLTSGGDGGNVIVDAPFVVGVLTENSDITANAFLGDGGTVTVTALDIIGLEFQNELTPFSDITASSEVGNAGITEFNRLTDVNPEDSLDEIPIDLTDPTSLIDRQCALQATPTASEFTVVGRGGLPIDPSQPSIAETFLEDLGTVPEPTDTANDQSRTGSPGEDATPLINESPPANVIREAQGWIQDEYGRMYLVSTAPQSPGTAFLADDDCSRSPTE